MNIWTAIVIIVAIGAVTEVLRSRYNARAGITEDMLGNQTLGQAQDPEREAREQAAQSEIAELKERIAVLERIATDHNSAEAREARRITSEIEALRGAGTKEPSQATKPD